MKKMLNERRNPMSEDKKPYIVDGQHVSLEEYRKTKYEDLRIRVPKGKKEEIKDFVSKTGKSLNAFVNEAIDEKIKREK
jgi:predicted HicB family RNase H-like nuclease